MHWERFFRSMEEKSCRFSSRRNVFEFFMFKPGEVESSGVYHPRQVTLESLNDRGFPGVISV